MLFKTAIMINPVSPDALCGYATLKLHNSNRDGAQELYKRALLANPLHAPSLSRYKLQSLCPPRPPCKELLRQYHPVVLVNHVGRFMH